MANYNTLISAIQSVIAANGNNEITGNILQQTLLTMIASLGDGYQFIGIATPETTPGTPDQKVFYIGSAGTYPNFGPAVIPDGCLGIFYYDSIWHYGTVAFPLGDGTITETKLSVQLLNKLFQTGYKYIGIATPSTQPSTPNQNVFYLAGAGTYPYFNNVSIPDGYLGVLYYDGVWHLSSVKVSVPLANDFNGGIDRALSAEMGKELNDALNELIGGQAVETIIDLSTYAKVAAGINAENLWLEATSQNQTRCLLIDLTGVTKVKVQVPINASGNGIIAFLKDANNIQTGNTPHFAVEYPARIVLEPGTTNNYDLTTDAKILYVAANLSSGSTMLDRYIITLTTESSSLLRKDDVVDNLNSELADSPLSAKQGSVLNDEIKDLIESGYRRIYPITLFGECVNGVITTGYSNEYTILDVKKYRGYKIFVNNKHSPTGCSQIRDDGDIVIANFSGENTTVGLIEIPDSASKFIISNSFIRNPNFFVCIPEKLATNSGLIFGANFLFDYDENDFSQFNGNVVANNGLLLNTGSANGLVVNKVIPLDNWSLIADIFTVNNTEIVVLGTKITQNAAANHSTRIEINFSTATISLYNNSTNVLVTSANFSTIINGNLYTIKLERINRAIKATIINRTTNDSVYVESLDGAAGSGNEGTNPAGKMFDSPIFYVESGSPYLQNLYATCMVRAKVLFVGDSITAGAHTTFETSWAQMAAEYFGNSLTGGRGSGEVICALNELRTLLPTVRPKAVVVTIGTNYNSNISRNGYIGLYKSILNIIRDFGAIPILNNIVACDARKTGLTILNGIIEELKQIGCRFDLATSLNNDWDDGQNVAYYYTDKVHLNIAGNTLLYTIIISQLEWIKNL